MSRRHLTRPWRPAGPPRIAALRAAVGHRNLLDATLTLAQHLESLRLDARLVRAGYLAATPARRWPRERTPAETEAQTLRRGPWLGGSWARQTLRMID